jgi:hypothetical protein
MWHLAAYVGSVPSTVAEHIIPAVQDGYLNLQDQRFHASYKWPVMCVAPVFSLNESFVLRSQRMRDISDHYVVQVVTSVGSNSVTALPFDFSGRFDVRPYDQVSAHILRTTGATATARVAVLLGSVDAVPQGERRTIRMTATVRSVADMWRSAQLAPDADLSHGEYAVIGAKVVAASTTVFARFRFQGQQMLPGLISTFSTAGIQSAVFRFGGLGLWGRFNQDFPPQIELLGSAAASVAAEAYLDIVRTGPAVHSRTTVGQPTPSSSPPAVTVSRTIPAASGPSTREPGVQPG